MAIHKSEKENGKRRADGKNGTANTVGRRKRKSILQRLSERSGKEGSFSLLCIKSKPFFGSPSNTVIILVFLLSLFGCLMVYSSSKYTAQKELGNEFYFLSKQLIGLCVGAVFFVFFYFFDYHRLKKVALPLAVVSAFLLGCCFVDVVNVEVLGAKRWIGFGNFTFQPSEIAKFALVLFIAVYLDKFRDYREKWWFSLPALCLGGLFCLLIIAEPNMSITVCVACIMLVMLFLGGARLSHVALIFIPLVAVAVVLIIIEPYRTLRLLAFIDPWASPRGEGYQLIQSLFALGNGGLFGVGLFNSRQKFEFLPFSESDFIFSVIGEEFGFFGAFTVIAVFVLLIYNGIKIARNAKDRFGAYLSAGIVTVVAIQTAVNVAVVTGSIPPTGLPLPFISYGGSSLAVFLGATGLLAGIGKKKINENQLKTT